MDDRQDQFSWLVLMVVVVPFVYVLSVGPVAWFFETMHWDISTARQLYKPVRWLHDHTFLKEPLEWYLALFGVR